MPTAGVATQETIEIFEAQTGWPQIKRPGLATMPVGHVVVLSIPCSVVAVLPQHFRERAVALGHERVVSGETCSQFHNHARGIGMVVPTGQQSRPRGRAECRGMELCVAETGGRQAIRVDVGTGPPKVLIAPKPTSSVRISRIFGAPLGALVSGRKSRVESFGVRQMWPLKGGSGRGRTSCAQLTPIIAKTAARTSNALLP